MSDRRIVIISTKVKKVSVPIHKTSILPFSLAIVLSIVLTICSGTTCSLYANNCELRGIVRAHDRKEPVARAIVMVVGTTHITRTDKNGNFSLRVQEVTSGALLSVRAVGYFEKRLPLRCDSTYVIELESRAYQAGEVVVKAGKENSFGIAAVEPVQGTALYEAKKTELITLEDASVNTATNNARQVFAKVAGLNIWESDQAGLQMGVGGRGLSPNRTAHFNTRQNGYDISADALGYPESYYTPPLEALERIEIIRGAASLQYGTQFGGLLNFVFKQGNDEKSVELTTRQSGGSYGFFNSFNSVGGTVGDMHYYSFYQYKRGDGWRPNSAFASHTAFASLRWMPTATFSLSTEYTHFRYTAQQPGGLTDAMFEQDPAQSVRARNWFYVNWNIAALVLDIKLNSQLRLNSRSFGIFSQRTAVGNLERINVVDFPNSNRTVIDGNFENVGNETRLLWTSELFENPAHLLTGIRVYSGNTLQEQGDGSANADADFRLLNPSNPENFHYRNPSTNVALFAESIIRITPQWNIVPGVRYEYINTKSKGWYNERVTDFAGNLISNTRVDESRTNARSLFLAGLGICFHATDVVEIYANASQNYRAVNFSDMRVVNPNMSIDSNLHDERGWTADLGIRGSVRNLLYFDASFFALRYADRIGLILRNGEAPLFLPYRYRTNIGSSQTYGFEGLAEWDFWKQFISPEGNTSVSLFVNTALLHGSYISSFDASVVGKEVELVPPFILRTGIHYRDEHINAGLQWSYTHRHYTDATNAERSSNAVNGIIPSYAVLDLSIRYTITPWLALEASCNNALDASYFTRRADSYPGPGIIPAERITLVAGIELRY